MKPSCLCFGCTGCCFCYLTTTIVEEVVLVPGFVPAGLPVVYAGSDSGCGGSPSPPGVSGLAVRVGLPTFCVQVINNESEYLELSEGCELEFQQTVREHNRCLTRIY